MTEYVRPDPCRRLPAARSYGATCTDSGIPRPEPCALPVTCDTNGPVCPEKLGTSGAVSTEDPGGRPSEGGPRTSRPARRLRGPSGSPTLGTRFRTAAEPHPPHHDVRVRPGAWGPTRGPSVGRPGPIVRERVRAGGDALLCSVVASYDPIPTSAGWETEVEAELVMTRPETRRPSPAGPLLREAPRRKQSAARLPSVLWVDRLSLAHER